MFDHILVPLDRSALAECVVPHAIAMAQLFNSHVTLLHVTDGPRTADLPGVVNPLEWQLRRAETEGYLQSVAQRFEEAGVAADKQLAEGDAAGQIIDVAHTQHADLILLGSHGQGGLSGWNVSSVAQKVALRAFTSLMIVRAYQPALGDPTSPYKRVLVPMDGSQRAEYVLPAVARFASQNAHVLLAHVVHRPEMPRRTPLTREDSELSDRYVERNRIEAEQYLSELCSRLPGDPGGIEARVVISDQVTSTLHELAAQDQVDLVRVSAHGYSGQSCWPFGSVVGSFIAYGATPLLIVQDAQPPSNGAFKSMMAQAVTREVSGFRGIGR